MSLIHSIWIVSDISRYGVVAGAQVFRPCQEVEIAVPNRINSWKQRVPVPSDHDNSLRNQGRRHAQLKPRNVEIQHAHVCVSPTPGYHCPKRKSNEISSGTTFRKQRTLESNTWYDCCALSDIRLNHELGLQVGINRPHNTTWSCSTSHVVRKLLFDLLSTPFFFFFSFFSIRFDAVKFDSRLQHSSMESSQHVRCEKGRPNILRSQ